MEGVIPNDLAAMLAQSMAKKPLAPYTTVTHVGKSTALVLPDGAGDHLTLLANSRGIDPSSGQEAAIGLTVHGIAVGRDGQKLTIKVIDGEFVTFVPHSDLAKHVNRLIMKNEHDATKVHVGESITFEYKVKAPGWQQT